MAKSRADEYPLLAFDNRQAWREWLAENHAHVPGVWLVFHKKDMGTSTLTYVDAVEEGLCYGWIDSLVKKLDDERRKQMFTPRKSKSLWSTLNKQRVERLIADGLMTPNGMAQIEAAKANGMWEIYDQLETLILPDELAEALSANPTAQDYFNAFSDSSKKNILLWLMLAKRPETRSKRIEEIVRLAALNKRANYPADK
jgi:uncharacterized protein YdeI (YjbR/CyaY-like superfamily)